MEKSIQVEHPRPRTASPHFTVSKITVPKPDHTYEVRRGGKVCQADSWVIHKTTKMKTNQN